MRIFDVCKALALNFLAIFSSSPAIDDVRLEQPLLPTHPHWDGPVGGNAKVLEGPKVSFEDPPTKESNYPHFYAPNGPDNGKNPFMCKYESLEGWEGCSTENDRGCWLQREGAAPENVHGHNPSDTGKYDIDTDYENYYPDGTVREYTLEVLNQGIEADGVNNPGGKIFKMLHPYEEPMGAYPGPWIQACWGDLIKVTIINNLDCNGTSIHWHGLRQHETVLMDGVNGVTECPLAPGKSFTYEFRAKQYGTTWYHSHYSLQYGDGLVGPLTVYGPSSASYDEAHDPLIITDWGHKSGFASYARELTGKPSRPMLNSVLINGRGNFAGLFSRPKYEMNVIRGKKYLLRIINTSIDTTYIFSIDNHKFKVISADFVPIESYETNHIVVGIGQRYHIILDATPIEREGWISKCGDYWLRVIPAEGCSAFEPGNRPDERQGVVKYNLCRNNPEVVPVSWRSDFSLACRDEPYDKLVPKLAWTVPERYRDIANSSITFNVGKEKVENRPVRGDKYEFWAMAEHATWLSFKDDPAILLLDEYDDNNPGKDLWPPEKTVFELEGTSDSWAFLIVTMPKKDLGNPKRHYIPVAHPIHLHGHDFALVGQGELPKDPEEPFQLWSEPNFKFDNPPRRDVALLPSGGYLVMAFKTDNPGIWLIHCHIAWHASSGLAAIVVERRQDLVEMIANEENRNTLAATRQVCADWKIWLETNEEQCANKHGRPFQEDSGI